jgi:lipoyl-dependent peroxiredoxin subunit C
MLTIGDKFPSFDLKAVVSTDAKTAFKQVSDKSDAGKWKVVFFWPKDFTFVCPTEIHGYEALRHGFAKPMRRSSVRVSIRSRCIAPGSSTGLGK